MGKGDRKTRRGKIWKGTYGVRRPARKQNVKLRNPAEQKQNQEA